MVVLWYQDWTYNSLKQQLVRQGHGLESEIVRDDVGFYVIYHGRLFNGFIKIPDTKKPADT